MSLLAGLPTEIKKKINKTKQTRGAQPYDRVPYQNRVNRTGIAVVPYAFRKKLHPDGFANGYRVMIRPPEYFSAKGVVREDFDRELTVGRNCFVYYDNRRDWRELPPPAGWKACADRLGAGEFIARVPATTATDKEKAKGIVQGHAQGIRFFEYATEKDVEATVAQLAFIAWHTTGIQAVRADGGTGVPKKLSAFLTAKGLGDIERFVVAGGLRPEGTGHVAICPLCRKEIAASELMSRMEQAEGREVFDLTVTEANLFHLRDLRPGEYNHRPYLLAWGHHHCNTVARDQGVEATVKWMGTVLERHGYTVTKSPVR